MSEDKVDYYAKTISIQTAAQLIADLYSNNEIDYIWDIWEKS